eukprot:scaffold14974_cov19-Tisochrysis_lutea.AAC.1
MESEETSLCHAGDGAESKQIDYIGDVVARRVDGKLEVRALSLKALQGKTAKAQADSYEAVMAEIANLMLKAGVIDERAAKILASFRPTCTASDRNATARKAERNIRDGRESGPDIGDGTWDDDPTCAEHALVNILEAARKAMDV